MYHTGSHVKYAAIPVFLVLATWQMVPLDQPAQKNVHFYHTIWPGAGKTCFYLNFEINYTGGVEITNAQCTEPFEFWSTENLGEDVR